MIRALSFSEEIRKYPCLEEAREKRESSLLVQLFNYNLASKLCRHPVGGMSVTRSLFRVITRYNRASLLNSSYR